MQKPKRKPRRREKEKRKIMLTIEAKDFGPISNGKITLKPLTLFIGPNNSGKSYAAMLIHSLFESYPPTLLLRDKFFFNMMDIFEEYFALPILREEFLKLKRQINGLKEDEELEITKEFIEKVTNNILKDIYEKRLSNEITRSYACPLNELIRIGKSCFELGIGFNSYNTYLNCHKNKLKIKEYPQINIKIHVKITKKYPIRYNIKEIGNNIFNIRIRGDKNLILFLIGQAILELVFTNIFKNIKHYYLPAARSGILQGHKALAASIVKKAPFVGIERLEIPKFSGVVADFLSSVISLPKEKGNFYQLAQKFERELIKGEIRGIAVEKHLYEIQYIFQKTRIPLHRASSTVSELAPLFLYLKYFVEPESILIIEEPEAHLHPENQRILAKYLVKLIRKDVNIIITTHSEYLLEQLSSFIMLSKIEPKKRIEKYKYGEKDYLKPDEISAYVFDYDEISGGHKINKIEITKENGISGKEFLKVHEALYEETTKLQRDLSAET